MLLFSTNQCVVMIITILSINHIMIFFIAIILFLHYIPKKGLILSAVDVMININLFILKILFFATLFTVCFLSSSHRNPEASEMSEAQSMPSRNSEPVGVEKGKQMNYVIK